MKRLVNNSIDPYFNMAFDEYCLQQYDRDETIFYLWRNRPSVIIGLNQNAFSEVNLEYLRSREILLARRVTGGGAVYHDLQNLNYTIVGPSAGPEPFAEALVKLGVKAEISGRNDIFVEGRKVSGYARRVWRKREIVHGTLMYNVDLEALSNSLNVPGSKLKAKGVESVRSRVTNLKDYLPQYGSLDEVQAELGRLLSCGDETLELSSDQLAEISHLSRIKFSTWEWIYGQSKAAEIRRSAKLLCGTVTADFSLDGGTIRKLSFSGDFLGDEPVEILSKSLEGVRMEHEVILRTLENHNIASFFRGATVNDILDLITGKYETS